MTNTSLLVLTGHSGFDSDLNKPLPTTLSQNTNTYDNNDDNSNEDSPTTINTIATTTTTATTTSLDTIKKDSEIKNNSQNGETILPKPYPAYLPFKIQSPSNTSDIDDVSLLSAVSNQFIYCVEAINISRKLFCSDEYPLSFTGEEAMNITRALIGEGQKDKFYRNLCRSLMALDPPLFEPVPYSEKSLKKNTFYDSEHEIYTLIDKEGLAQGVYLLLTKCYSPRCQVGNTYNCYSPCCPNKSGPKVHRATLKIGGTTIGSKSLKSSIASSHDTTISRAWAASIPKEVLQSTPPDEIKRQEAIHELIYTEEDYVRDLKLLDELFAKPLLTAQCIEQDRRVEFCEKIFVNYMEILNIHQELSRELRDYQETCHLNNGFVNRIGNIFLKFIHQFDAIYFKYGPNVTLADYIIKKEMSDNMLFLNFIREKEKQAETRKLPFRHFLLLPVTRLQRYSLLLNAVHKKTPDDHPDKVDLLTTINTISHAAKRMDTETEESKRILRLWQIHDQLVFNKEMDNHHHHHHTNTSNLQKKWTVNDLQLLAPERKLLYEGDVIRKNSVMENVTLHLFLFDHYFVITKPKKPTNNTSKRSPGNLLSLSSSSPSSPPPPPPHGLNNNDGSSPFMIDYNMKYESYHISKTPIPLYLLHLYKSTESFAIGEYNIPSPISLSRAASFSPPTSPTFTTRNNTLPLTPIPSSNNNNNNNTNALAKDTDNESSGVAFKIIHIGRYGNEYTFYLDHQDSVSYWQYMIVTAKAEWEERNNEKKILQTHCLTDHTFGNFLTSGKVKESVVYENASGKQMIIFSSNQGLWVGSRDGSIVYQQVMSQTNIQQIGVLQDEHILLVLAEKILTAYPLASFDPSSKNKPSGSYKVSQHVQYFTCGKMMGTSLVIVMKRQGMDSTFKVFEPVCGNLRDPANSKFLAVKHRFLSKAPAWFRLYKSFYIGCNSIDIQILKARLAIVSERGFEIIDLDTLKEIHLPSPQDENKLTFLYPPNVDTKPLAMYKYKDYFLLCYNDFAFLVDYKGCYSTKFYEKIDWIGTPHSVAFYDPYIVAFDHQLIEIRHIETGELVQVISGTTMQSLCLNPILTGVMTHPYDTDKQYVFELVPKN